VALLKHLEKALLKHLEKALLKHLEKALQKHPGRGLLSEQIYLRRQNYPLVRVVYPLKLLIQEPSNRLHLLRDQCQQRELQEVPLHLQLKQEEV
jgi:hypothetical protein